MSWIFVIGFGTLVVATACWFAMRRRYLKWGTTEAEAVGPMRGDEEVPEPTYETTLAIGIDASAEDIWPWLVQLGYRRGGLYSYDWLDRLFGYLDAPSATRILPEFQHLKAGDSVPVGRGPAFPVTVVQPLRTLVMAGKTDDFQWSWQFEIRPRDARRARLISRNRARVPQTAGRNLFMLALAPAAFLMTRRMLIGIKGRAENLAAARSHATRQAA